jgi:ferric iron reductase protein FhuF
MLWGNVAASAATAFRTMQGYSGNAVELMGEQFFDLAKPPLQGQGSFRVVESRGRRGWFWERTSCCLIDRLPEGIRCADCSLTPPAQRLSDYRAWLDAS